MRVAARHPAPAAVRPVPLGRGAALRSVHRRSAVSRRADVRALRPSHGAAGRRVPRVRRAPAGVRPGRRRSRLRGRRAGSSSSQLKSGRRRALARPAGAAIATMLGVGACEAVCWVPGDRWRTIQRGCHPAELLAREVARRWRLPAVDLLEPARPAAAAAGAGHGRQAAERPRGVPGPGRRRARGRRAGRRRVHDRRNPRRVRAGAPGGRRGVGRGLHARPRGALVSDYGSRAPHCPEDRP